MRFLKGVMTLTIWLKLAALLIALVAAVSVYFAWREAQHEQAQLKAELQVAQQALTDAGARQQSRNAELAQLLAQFNEEKSTVQSPAQVVKALPATLGEARQPLTSPNPKVQLPSEDLKPIYDFAVNCQECQAQLTATQANLRDEQLKTQALSRERDTALQAARGGSVLHRVVRAAKWFVIGAAAGAVAAKLAR